MARFVERRKYRRFEIPGGLVKIGKVSGYPSLKAFSQLYPVLNASISGVNVLFPVAFNTGEEILVELHAPEEKPIRLRSRVIWTSPVPLSNDILTGFEFFPFGEDKGFNSPEAMGVLRRLYARYITP